MTDASQLLGPDGPLALQLDGYEHRRGQLLMADLVERALDEDRIVLCEAGTGTGKTLAYLVPAMLSGRRVVISTASKALQEQIMDHDIPLIRQHLQLDADVQLVKGLSNYLCLRRLAEAQRRAFDSRAVRRSLPMVERWALETETGDVSELANLPESDPLWRAVASSSDTRIGTRCRHYEDCFVTALKRRAEKAQILVVNHHLFFADLAIKGDHSGGVLPPYDAVIFDEAHKIESVASSFFGARVSADGVRRLLSEVERGMRRAQLHSGEDPPRLVRRCRRAADELFARLNQRLATPSRHQEAQRRHPLPTDAWREASLREGYHTLDDTLIALHDDILSQARDESSLQLTRRLDQLRQRLTSIVEPQLSTVVWIERQEHSLALSASPVHVGPILREKLHNRGSAVVLTSASLTTREHFDFMRARLGLDDDLALPIDEMVVPPALDYAACARLYLPRDLPAVDDRHFSAAAAERIAELVALTPGGCFVLCTSNRSMHRLAQHLEELLDEPPLVQGQAPKATLLDRFREHGDATLVATMSFWEGVDVPGQALALVVIDRIPFAVPSDPLVAARCQALTDDGRAAFAHYMLPMAAMTLKQGFGRLLRTRRDRGIVAVLDSRLHSKSYRHVLLASLPPAPICHTLDDITAFWATARPL